MTPGAADRRRSPLMHPGLGPASPSARLATCLLVGLLGASCADEPTALRTQRPPATTPAATTPADGDEARSSSDGLDVLDARAGLGGQVAIDGSSTVYPITEAIAARFEDLAPAVEIRLGVSGTGGGFERFCRGETDISDASRPIKASEAALCAEHGVRFIELPVAFDGISVVAHRDAAWVTCMTVEELRRTWRPEATGEVTRWSDLRADWPERPLELYAPGRDSGTFDYFTRAIVGAEGSSRGDFVGSEDDYLLAQDVAADPAGLGFFGYAYYREYADRLRLIGIDAGAGCVAPSEATIADGTYRPLARPIFIYVSAEALERPEIAAFVDVYLDEAPRLVEKVGYVPLPARAYALDKDRVRRRLLGSVFDGGSQVGVSIEQLLTMEGDAELGGGSP